MPKPDPAHKETDKILAEMEKKLHSVYKQAYKEAKETADTFLKQFREADKKKREQVKNGDLDKDEYARWRRTQVFQSNNYRKMADTLAADMTNSNKIAASVINGYLPEVYAVNYNYGTYEIEKGSKINTSFTLYDRQTVERLLRDEPDLLPMKAKVNVPKDEQWNKKHINSAITQGILQGESIDKISQRLAATVTDMSQTSAIRNARTMTTSAQNGGRIDSYKRAESMGIKLMQVWLSTLDNRTRHEHILLDGQKRKVGEPFEVDGEKIYFPGDPSAEPYLTYNCRCTLIGVVTGIDYKLSDTSQRDNKLGDMTYEEWKDSKQRQDNAEPPAPKPEPKPKAEEKPAEVEVPAPFVLSDNVSSVMGDNASEYTETIEKADKRVRNLYENYSKNLEHLSRERGGGSYNKAFNELIFDYNANGDKFETISHEFGHFFDVQIPKENYTTKELDVLNANVKLGSIDFFKACASSSDEFLTAMRKDRELNRKFMTDKEERDIIIADLKRSVASAGIQDAFDGWWSTQDKRLLTWGHGDKYYNRQYGNIKKFKQDKQLQKAFKELGFDASNQAKVKRILRDYEAASELWANVTAAKTCGGEQLEYMKKYMPNSLKAWEEICGKV
ncbi:MAG: hypothetical protein II249_03320 [Bacteroidaceae bacterium]|nr:hypothetical protein [Bacteroidaceae bacterium]